MPARQQDKVSVTCPKCGHAQLEPREAYSTICKRCHAHFRLEETARPASRGSPVSIAHKKVVCFQCGTTLEVPATAESTMCKRCGQHVDLRDYEITSAVSKNFRTHGRFVVETKGNVFNTEVDVGEAIIKGRFLGKLVAHRSLTIYSTAQIKGSFQAACLIIPEGNYFRWPELAVGSAEIGGELVSTLRATGTVLLKATARFFGDVEAQNLVIESGAVWVGQARIGQPAETKPASPAKTTAAPPPAPLPPTAIPSLPAPIPKAAVAPAKTRSVKASRAVRGVGTDDGPRRRK